jgi:hypothetical protein
MSGIRVGAPRRMHGYRRPNVSIRSRALKTKRHHGPAWSSRLGDQYRGVDDRSIGRPRALSSASRTNTCCYSSKERCGEWHHMLSIRHPLGNGRAVMLTGAAAGVDSRRCVRYERRRPEQTVLYLRSYRPRRSASTGEAASPRRERKARWHHRHPAACELLGARRPLPSRSSSHWLPHHRRTRAPCAFVWLGRARRDGATRCCHWSTRRCELAELERWA